MMRLRPKVVAFDVIGTLFSLEPLRSQLVDAGLPGSALELWFAHSLRDAFALAATDRFQPFRSVLETNLDQVLGQHGLAADSARTASVVDGFGALPPHPDAADAFRTLADAGIRIVALSNGGASLTQKLLQQADLSDDVERVISVDEVKLAKPRREIYLHAASVAGVEPGELALVASHAWDVHGAKAAGLMAAFVARGRAFPSIMLRPDVQGDSLSEVATVLATAS